MKKRIYVIIAGMLMLLLGAGRSVYASGNDSDEAAGDVIGQVKQELTAIFENVDQETAGEVFSFLKEKISDGNLGSEEGLLNAIREGEEQFGVEISREGKREK